MNNGVGWIVVSGLLLPAGWFAWLMLALAGDFGPEEQRPGLAAQTGTSVVITLITAGIPAAVGVVLLIRRRTDRSITWVGPVACLVIAVLGLGTTGFATVSLGRQWHADSQQRAAPLTALETSRTPDQAARDLKTLGKRSVEALGGDFAAGDVGAWQDSCPLSNLQRGTTSHWHWGWSSVPDDVPQGKADEEASHLPEDQVVARTAAIRALLEDAGLTAEPLDTGLILNSRGWLQQATVRVTSTEQGVGLDTVCLARNGAK